MMAEFKSVSFWVAKTIVAFGMATVMSIVTPLLLGAPLVFHSTVFLIVTTGLVALFSTTCLPIPRFCRWVNHLFTVRSSALFQDILFTIILTAIMATAAQLLSGQVQLMFWVATARIFPWLVIVAYFSVMLFKRVAKRVVARMSYRQRPVG